MFIFWSKEDGGEELLKGLAAAALEKKEELAGRLEIISFNLDELPDAGESIVRGLGVGLAGAAPARRQEESDLRRLREDPTRGS